MTAELYKFCKDTISNLSQGLETAYNTISSRVNYLGKKVSNFTKDYLAPTAKEACKGAPYTLALMPFAFSGFGPLAAYVARYAVPIFEERLGPETSKNAYIGIRNFCILGAAMDATRAITIHPIFLMNVSTYGVIANIAQTNVNQVAARA